MKARNILPTTDKAIRAALRENLQKIYESDSTVKIIEELGLVHGEARIDLAVVNGSIHGYELKSDLDTLRRLPEQMRIYNSVLDQVTLVVGKNHLFDAFNIIPEWWGVTIAKVSSSGNKISFCSIRNADENPEKNNVAIAKLLWREEALHILEEKGVAGGIRSKSRQVLYERLAEVLNQNELRAKVREYLSTREGWRSNVSLVTSGD
jgi:hypothetical protein